jgi:hypothetical protein
VVTEEGANLETEYAFPRLSSMNVGKGPGNMMVGLQPLRASWGEPALVAGIAVDDQPSTG